MEPNHKDGNVDWKDAEHEDEDGMGVVVEIMMDPRTLFKSENLCISACKFMNQKNTLTSVSRANFNARMQVAICTRQASK